MTAYSMSDVPRLLESLQTGVNASNQEVTIQLRLAQANYTKALYEPNNNYHFECMHDCAKSLKTVCNHVFKLRNTQFCPKKDEVLIVCANLVNNYVITKKRTVSLRVKSQAELNKRAYRELMRYIIRLRTWSLKQQELKKVA